MQDAPNATRASEQEGTGQNRITAEILRTERGETVHRYTVDGRTYDSLEELHAATDVRRQSHNDSQEVEVR